MRATAPSAKLPERAPMVGELVRVRSRQWLVEAVVEPRAPGESSIVRLACADDDAQGQGSSTTTWNAGSAAASVTATPTISETRSGR